MTTQAQGGASASYVRIHPIPLLAARVAVAGGGICLALVALLHLLKPELDPSWRFVSEYAVGQHGWVMGVGFFALAAGYAAAFLIVRSQVRGVVGFLGLAFLLAAVVGLTLAAFFPMDPITIDPAEATAAGNMHALAAMIGMPSVPIAAMLISFNLARKPLWRPARAALVGWAMLALVSIVLMSATIMVLMPDSTSFGPDVAVGWPNRLVMLAYCGWVISVGWQAARLAR